MKKLNSPLLLLLFMATIMISSCKKSSSDDDATPTPDPATTPRIFSGLTFSPTYAFFSTDGSMSAPIDSNTAKTVSAKIDFTYFYNHDYSKPGFLDAVTRSAMWYWDDYYSAWLNNAKATNFYSTTLTEANFAAAKADQSKIGSYFPAAANLVPHAIFPTGTCIGGRQTSSPTSVLLNTGDVFAFKQLVSGKRGLLLIRTDQSVGWPNGIVDFNTKVDIIIEK